MQTVEVMTQPTPGTDMQKRPYTYTFCLEHVTQGPYKVCKPGTDLLHDAKGVSSVNDWQHVAGLLDDSWLTSGRLWQCLGRDAQLIWQARMCIGAS